MTLNISEEMTSSIVHNGKLDIARLIELYGPDRVLEDYVEQAHRCFTLSICALAAYMLVPSDGRVSLSLVSVASQMGARKNIIPMVLAETLMGLDSVKNGQVNMFSSCPLLLQVGSHLVHLFLVCALPHFTSTLG